MICSLYMDHRLAAGIEYLAAQMQSVQKPAMD